MATPTTEELHLRRSIKHIDSVIDEMQKARAALIALLPKKKVDVSTFTIKLPNGKILDCMGKEVKNGNRK